MAGPALLFRDVHRLRRHIHDLQENINRYPIQLKAQQAKVTRQEEAQRTAQETLKKLKVGIHNKEITLKTTQTNVAKHEKQLAEASGKKEYDAHQVEIANGKAKSLQLEEEILNDMTEVDERTAKLPDLEKAVQDARAEFARWQKATEEKLIEQKSQLVTTQGLLKEVEANIPDKIRDVYKRIVAAKGPDAFAPVNGRFCGGCSTEITNQLINDLKQGALIVCRSCERLLYLPE